MAYAKPLNVSESWRLEDAIDFDYAVETAFKADGTSPADHRQIFLTFLVESGLEGQYLDSSHRETAFRYWLEAQRRHAPASTLWPGTIFCHSKRVLAGALIVAGLLSGVLASASLLHYDGTQPINVATFLFFLLGGQLLLLLIATEALLLRRFGFLSLETGIVTPLIQFTLNRTSAWIQKGALSHCTGETRLQLAAFLGSLGKKQSRYQPMIVGIITGLAQTFSVWFNIAAISTTLLLVTVSDRAFGWQSSLNLSPARVHQVTGIIARPWAWFYPEGAPTVSQIEGSRIYLKDGIRTLVTTNLVSWWPFLVCSLLTYGLLPRLLLWLATWIIVRWQLKKLRFNSLTCDRLWENMNRRQLDTTLTPETHADTNPSPVSERPSGAPAPMAPSSDHQTAYLIIEPELSKRINHRVVAGSIHRQINWTISKWLKLPDETESWSDFRNALKALQTEETYARLVVLQEAFQPPIRESLNWLKQLRASQGASGKLMILLVGRPEDAGQVGVASQTNHRIWEQSLAALSDGNIAVAPLSLTDDNE
ncbi:MAG: hypothetical protein M2R45_00572 [Verrucomicrobia subdivision 3 bacterium]|nr:hypothetical protein [Limisphaerales bacterium]MCS1413551.1 hypothetical protein [Limisphaerales bacterium]